MLQSQKQALRLRRATLANLGVFLNIFLSLLAAQWGFFVISYMDVLLLTTGVWLGHLTFVALIFFNVNTHFKDASLTLPQMLWVISCLSIIMFFVEDVRPLMLMGYLLVMSFGTFRLNLKELYGVTVCAILNYLLCVYLIYYYRPHDIQLSQELLIFFGFVFVLMGFAFMGVEFSNLRRALKGRHKELETAFSRIKELAITDELTGLYNRRHLLDIIAQHRAMANRSQYNFVVCYLDLDHFKKVNDQYGHPFGDKVLQSFSSLISDSLRQVDIGARMGGEEFVLILADTNLETAHHVCQRISDKWAQQVFNDAPTLSLTLSSGIAQFRAPESVSQLIERADKLLYEAKNNGRNCIVMEQQELQVPFVFDNPSAI